MLYPKNDEKEKEKKKEELQVQSNKYERKMSKFQLINLSEDYYEKNLNAFNNNMSLLALNTYEIT